MILLGLLLTGTSKILGDQVGENLGILELKLLKEKEFAGVKLTLLMPLLEEIDRSEILLI